MSSDLDWVDEEKQVDYCRLLEVLRESGDGESKETSPHTSASEDDNQETKQALIDVNRKVERRKDKKISKIPVWQAKASHHADVSKSTYGNSCYSQQLDFSENAGIPEEIFYKICDKRHSLVVENKIQTDSGFGTFGSQEELGLKMSDFNDSFAIPISDPLGCNELDISEGELKSAEDNVTNLGNTNVSEIEKEKLECGQTSISETVALKQPNTRYDCGIKKENGNCSVECEKLLFTKLENDFVDIIYDITSVPELNDSLLESSSLSPRAPLATEDLEDHILEAPEEFRSLHDMSLMNYDNLATISEDQVVESWNNAAKNCVQLEKAGDDETFHVSHMNVGEPKQCRISASARDHDKASTPEVNNACGRESNKDTPKNVERGIETSITSNTQESKGICMTNEGKYGVIQLEALDRKVNANECAKFAAPCETIEIMRSLQDSQRVFTDMNGGVSKDNDQIQSDSINASETKPHVDVNACEDRVCDISLTLQNGASPKLAATDKVTHNCIEGMVGMSDKETNEYVGLRNGLGKLLVSRVVADTKVGGNVSSVDKANGTNGGNLNDTAVTLSSVSEPCADNSCPEGRDSVNGPNSSVSNIGAYACAGNEQTLATAKASIAIGVARCAQAPRCSRISAATVCAASTADSSKSSTYPHKSSQLNYDVTEKCFHEGSSDDSLKQNSENQSTSDILNTRGPFAKTESVDIDNCSAKRSDFSDEKQFDIDAHLIWEFKNGRLVFDSSTDTESECASITQSERSSRPIEVSQCQPEDTTNPPLLQIIEKCVGRIESSANKISADSPSVKLHDADADEVKDVLCSRDLNRRVVEGKSRLKHLENKLKEAGITDGKTNIQPDVDQADTEVCKYKSATKHLNETEQVVFEISENKEKVEQVVDKLTVTLDNENLGFDDNQNVVCSEPVAHDLKSEVQSGASEDSIPAEDLLPETDENADLVDFSGGGGLCEFDVRQVGSFAGFTDSDFYVVYDELEDSSDEDECEHEYYHIISKMRGDGSMGTDGERVKQHNPDRENLKSLLKKPGRGRDVKKNRVVFNENKNEFFDADYIILIREECDYDDEEDDGVCTCNEHEMVRLTCCEPNCNCNIYEGYSDPTPQSPKFAPPLEFVDAVTLSPPEGYKDMELGEQQLLALQQMARRGQRTAVCRDCSATHEGDGEGSQSDNEDNGETQSDHEDAREETEKTDQSQQTTPTTPSPAETESPNQHQYVLETVTMTTVTERRIMREMEEEKQRSSSPSLAPGGSPISGILKGGRLWKQHSQDINNIRNIEQPATDSSVTSDEESNGNRRSVRFIEADENKRDCCDGAVDKPEVETAKQTVNLEQKPAISCNNSVSPESTEMMLTFKLGNHILISNNSLKPNSAVRQLFPCSKPLSSKPGDNDSVHQYLVTAESLRAFEEAKRSKLPQIIQSDETDESIKRAIERNTLRRSLIRYEPRPKKKEQKTDNSLVERIKQLTCDVDDVIQEPEDIPQRASPTGEEARKSPEVNHLNKNHDKSFSPSSSSTASSNSSSVSSTYKKITDLFAKREKPPDIQNNTIIEPNTKPLNQLGPAPDLGNTGPHQQEYISHHCPVAKTNSTSDARKQFLSTLAPLTACVSGTGADDHYYHVSHHVGDRSSVTSSVGTEYSLEDIDEGLKNEDDDTKRNAPDVVVGTPSASESGDELAMFVQQDASRIERIKKKYQQDNSEDDEHDDYGFNKRPSVRGIKPRFGTTTEILQQIQNQMQPPQTAPKVNPHVAWPYYSEASLSGLDNNKSRNINQNVPQYQYTYVTEEMKTKMYVQQYRPTTLVEDNMYQNCANQRCNREVAYKSNVNNHVHSPVMRIGGGCSELYHQAIPSRSRNGRPESPPPFDVAKNIHQTMVYIPYNHIESYQPGCVSPNPQYQPSEKCYARVINQNQINNRYIEPVYHNQPRMGHPPVDEPHYQVNVLKQVPKPMMRLPYPLPNSTSQPHLMQGSRSDSPLPGQFSTARSTQTSAPTMATCNYYPTVTPRYRPAMGPVIAHAGVVYGENLYGSKINRHSFPVGGPRYPAPDNISLTDSESQYSAAVPNGYRQTIETTFSAQKDSVPNSPTKPRFIERGVPEGAASVSPQDSAVIAQSTSTMTSPTSPQNPQQGNPKPLFYAMNV